MSLRRNPSRDDAGKASIACKTSHETREIVNSLLYQIEILLDKLLLGNPDVDPEFADKLTSCAQQLEFVVTQQPEFGLAFPDFANTAKILSKLLNRHLVLAGYTTQIPANHFRDAYLKTLSSDLCNLLIDLEVMQSDQLDQTNLNKRLSDVLNEMSSTLFSTQIDEHQKYYRMLIAIMDIMVSFPAFKAIHTRLTDLLTREFYLFYLGEMDDLIMQPKPETESFTSACEVDISTEDWHPTNRRKSLEQTTRLSLFTDDAEISSTDKVKQTSTDEQSKNKLLLTSAATFKRFKVERQPVTICEQEKNNSLIK
jgi:hypothetical protein